LDSAVKTFLLVSAAYLLGGAGLPEADRDLDDPDPVNVEYLRQRPGEVPEDASPLVAAFDQSQRAKGGSG